MNIISRVLRFRDTACPTFERLRWKIICGAMSGQLRHLKNACQTGDAPKPDAGHLLAASRDILV